MIVYFFRVINTFNLFSINQPYGSINPPYPGKLEEVNPISFRVAEENVQ